MNQQKWYILLMICCITLFEAAASTFTYQGRLVEDVGPSSGNFDLEFKLFDAATAGNQISQPFHAIATTVEAGIFTVELTFPDSAFTGQDRWLQIGVRTNGGATFTDLTPRQKIGSIPQATYATTAARTLSNSVDTASIAPGAVTSSKIADGSVVRSLNGLTDHVQLVAGTNIVLNTSSNRIEISAPTTEWSLNGNIINSNQFLGSINGQPLEIRANNKRAMWFEDRPEGANITAGHSENRILQLGNSPVYPHGSVILGGGAPGAPNTIGGHYSLIGGGAANWIGGAQTAPSGITNLVQGCSIIGGRSNRIESFGFSDAVGTYDATIVGGRWNTVGANSEASTITGGERNILEPCTYSSTIGGGRNNNIRGGCDGSFNYDSVISGGSGNRIEPNCWGSTIGGGVGNVLSQGAGWMMSTIGGGSGNWIQAPYAVISGGGGNGIRTNAEYAAIGGGSGNIAVGPSSAIGGGRRNTAPGEGSAIAGGVSNIVEGFASAIPGGRDARAHNFGQFAYASGQFATTGDAQFSMYVSRAVSSNSTPLELTLDGQSKVMTIRTNSSWSFDALVIGRSPTQTISFQIRGAVENTAGTCALVGTPAKQTFGSNPDGWNALVIADTARNALIVSVVGSPDTLMRWVANVRVAEVGF